MSEDQQIQEASLIGARRTERPATPLLQVRDVHTHFDTPRGVLRAVDGVSFDLEHGRTTGIVGESGSGKSVLARTIMGLLPRNALRVGGEVHYRGAPLSELSHAEAKHFWGVEMAMVFQDPMTSLNPVKRIGRSLTESIRYHLRLNRGDAADLAVDLLEQVGISDPMRRLRQFPHELSGGMRQRVTIAIALSCGPKLLVADEPTTALDVTVQKQILDLLQRIQAERHMGTLLITHDLGVVASRTDEIIVMYAGRVVEQAPTSTLFSHRRHPYTEALLRSIPRVGQPSHTRLEAIGGRPPDLVAPSLGCSFAPRCRHAQARCLDEVPSLVPSGEPGHTHACFFPVGTAEGEQAIAVNLSIGHTAAGLPVTGDISRQQVLAMDRT